MNYTEKRRTEVKKILRRFLTRNLQRGSGIPDVINTLTELVQKFESETLYTQEESQKIQVKLLEVQYHQITVEDFNQLLKGMEV